MWVWVCGIWNAILRHTKNKLGVGWSSQTPSFRLSHIWHVKLGPQVYGEHQEVTSRYVTWTNDQRDQQV